MGRSTKFFISLIAIVAALFVVAAIAFLFLFDPNDFREDVERAVKEETGRDLVISGDVSMQVFPWLAVEVGEAELGNAPGFGDEPFAAFEQVTFRVQFLPLVIRQEVVVGTAEVDGLRLNLVARDNGTDNWSDLASAEAAQDSDGAIEDIDGRTGTLEISGIAIRDAAVSYTSGADTYSLVDANFTLGPVSGDGEALHVGAISLEAIVEGASEIPTELVFESAGVDVENNVATVHPIDLSVLGIDMHIDLEPVNLDDSATRSASLSIDAFSPRSVMTQLGIAPPETADPGALSKVIVDAKATFRDSSVSLTGVNIVVDDTSFTGGMTVPFEPTGRFILKLAGDAIDLNRYMAPPTEGGAGGGESAPVEIPADLIRPLNVRGDLALATVLMAGLQMDNVTLSLDAANGRMRLHPIAADLYGGSYNGDVRIDVSGKTPVLSMDENVQGVDLAKLAQAMFEQQNITGTIAGNFKLSGRGNDMAEIQQTLGGTMSFELKDGYYEGTDVWYELRRARAMLKKETPPEPVLPARTKFSSVSASSVVTDGVMRNDDFVADLPFMQITGAGTVDIVAATVDYSLKARVYEKPEAMEGATAEEIDDLTKTVIPLKITGPLTSPSVIPDVEELLRQRVEEEIKDKLEDKLKDLFGN